MAALAKAQEPSQSTCTAMTEGPSWQHVLKPSAVRPAASTALQRGLERVRLLDPTLLRVGTGG